MTFSTCHSEPADATASRDPGEALTLATGVEVGVFGQDPATFPPTCLRSCIRSSQSGHAEGACALVRGLVEGTIPNDRQDPKVCDRGHVVAVGAGVGRDSAVLLLRPSPANAEEARAVDYAAQMHAAGTLWQQFERISQESHGLALELISSYEQLNLIFDITKRVGEVQNAYQVKLFLVKKLAETLSCDWACCISQSKETHWWCVDDQEDESAIVAWVRLVHADMLEAVREQRRVVVRNRSASPDDVPSFSMMAGPLGNGDGGQDIVVVGRRQDHPEFQTGEMRMLDSVLGHGGQVISNLQLLERLKTLSFETVLALVSAIDKKDSYTSGHSERVGLLSRLIGEEMALSPTVLQDLEWAGILHDVGKIGISDTLLTKPGSLTDEEFDLIKQHPRMSIEVIEPLRSFGAVREAILHHHETPDGEGYPDGLKGDQIPLLARIIHVADTFDALTSDRSYRKGFPVEEAIAIMRTDTGTKIDPQVMAAFGRALEAYRTRQPDRFRERFRHTVGREREACP